MTEETVQPETQQENQGINISVEQILASILNTVGPITVQLEKLIENYGNRSISVNQNEDKSVVFDLVENPKSEEVTESAE